MAVNEPESFVAIVRGRVQGVGFRAFVQRKALGLGLEGTVRNLDDGSVEVRVSGFRNELDALEAQLHQGPTFSKVTGVQIDRDITVDAEGFRITY